jgi:hypothetical protein
MAVGRGFRRRRGADRAAAPPRFSITIGCPSCLESGSCTMRAITSVPPPGG